MEQDNTRERESALSPGSLSYLGKSYKMRVEIFSN